MKKQRKIIPIMIVAAAAIMLLFTTQTDTGTAFIKQLKDMFVPKKEITQSIEGTEEETEVVLQEGKDAEYVIYMDEERYKLVKGESSDIITTKEPLEDRYPEVSMEIKQFKDVSPEDMVVTLETEIASTYTTVTETENRNGTS